LPLLTRCSPRDARFLPGLCRPCLSYACASWHSNASCSRVLHNFNQETLRFPALAAKLSVDFPAGMRSRGVDTELKGIVTRSFGQTRAHLNVGYEFVGHAGDGERNGRYEIVLGAQYPLGYPRFLNTTVLADVFTQQSVHSGESNPTGVEVGIRQQIAPLTVIDVGVGTEFAGPAERTPVFATVGISVGF